MADEPKTEPQEPAKQEPASKTFTQEELDRVVGERLAREREKYSDHDELKAKAQRLEEIEEANKSELEKAASQRDKFKTDAERFGAENTRLRVAIQKGLVGDKADLVDRLRGNTKEELEADADALLKMFEGQRQDPAPNFDGGPREPAPEQKTPDQAHNDVILRLAGLTPNN